MGSLNRKSLSGKYFKKVKKDKTTICLVVPTLQPGGMERVKSELAGHFAQKTDKDLHMVLYAKGRDVFYALPQNITLNKPDWPFDNKKRRWYNAKTLFYFRRTVKKINPDTILSYGVLEQFLRY